LQLLLTIPDILQANHAHRIHCPYITAHFTVKLPSNLSKIPAPARFFPKYRQIWQLCQFLPATGYSFPPSETSRQHDTGRLEPITFAGVSAELNTQTDRMVPPGNGVLPAAAYRLATQTTWNISSFI
jgi:hypothetical protein